MLVSNTQTFSEATSGSEAGSFCSRQCEDSRLLHVCLHVSTSFPMTWCQHAFQNKSVFIGCKLLWCRKQWSNASTEPTANILQVWLFFLLDMFIEEDDIDFRQTFSMLLICHFKTYVFILGVHWARTLWSQWSRGICFFLQQFSDVSLILCLLGVFCLFVFLSLDLHSLVHLPRFQLAPYIKVGLPPCPPNFLCADCNPWKENKRTEESNEMNLQRKSVHKWKT